MLTISVGNSARLRSHWTGTTLPDYCGLNAAILMVAAGGRHAPHNSCQTSLWDSFDNDSSVCKIGAYPRRISHLRPNRGPCPRESFRHRFYCHSEPFHGHDCEGRESRCHRDRRLPQASQRLDPPLIDVLIEDGYRKGDVNLAEVRFIVDEIKRIISDQAMADRTIGVVSLLGDKQAYAVWKRLIEEVGPEELRRHRIECGDARAFQGKERHIMFLTTVSAPNEVGAPLSRDTFAQRFNVAASRAQDRMYLVRSVEFDHLSAADRLRRGLITHFSTPFVQDETRVEDLRTLCESPFERELYDELTQRGYWVTPQVNVGQYRIDLVVEGNNDMRLAVECDGDRYHGSDKWVEDMDRQRVLERAGWTFWRSFASAFVRRRDSVMRELLNALTDNGVEAIAGDRAPRSLHSEFRRITAGEDLLVS